MIQLKPVPFLILLVFVFETGCAELCSKNDIHALILARGGSKGIKLKNLAEVGGLSLLARTIITIKDSSCFKHIWVSTDDKRIAIEAQKYGAIVHHRPEKFARDDTPSIHAITEFLGVHKGIQDFALFQCTSVFLKTKYIQEAVRKFETHDCVFAAKRSHYLRWKMVDDILVPAEFDLNARPRRQDWKGDIVETGMFYFSRRQLINSGLLQNNRCSIVEIDVKDGLEIDSNHDLTLAKYIFSSETKTDL
ncbi:N-acylneuraminate cytidylyltransferase A [Drosophila rhopaloa]|uniref:N-acylneuraminate cytidylyltransferase n=1 Tax=Drosophila rhopaloa TaxID=1041015 RepID=A0ABM5JFC6_DRORH|nr:N-acylneuraminate cytidylyltransferase A [Drosophila rhopaloa]